MKISVIVPAYNEEKAVGETLGVLERYLRQNFPDYEIIVVSDGSRDRTFEIAKALESERVRVFEYQPNQGKGHALKYGFGQARGELIVFYDTGLNFPPSQIAEFIQVMRQSGSDLVIGSKRHPRSKVDYPFKRRVISLLAQLCVKVFFNLDITDTQVGLKVFRREVLEKVMPLILVRRYAFDIELLALSQYYGFKIVEAPVKLDLKFSTAGTVRAVAQTFQDTLATFYRLRILHFYDLPELERERLIREYRSTVWERLVVRFVRLFGGRNEKRSLG